LSPWSYQVLQRGSATPILVAATGGGIQAAAWSARVLAGIDESLSADLKDEFTDSIRLFSTVSGGGVGVMYFAERYRAGHFDHQYGRPNAVVQRAEVSSLDDAAWGAAFPDAIATFLPPIRMIFGDRGQALEVAWTRSQEVGRLLSDWRTEVWSDVRPANIFNATLVDTGERLLIGTSRVGWRQKRGLRNFEDVYPDREIQVVTAARLAASFTYVSPATRTDAHETPYHVVDGGYYDDYGMTTLTEWLDEALEGVGGEASFPQVLVIQIRSDSGRANPSANTWLHGVLYQAWAPVETILKVRTTGQISHNDEEFERLQRLWKDKNVKIYNVVFRFCGEHPPLSWHLTETEKNAIEAEWQRQREGPGVQAIRNFLRHQPIADTRADAPLDVPLTPCP